MNLAFVTVHVKDLEESLAFYQGVLGLEISRRFKTGPDGEIAFLGEEGAQVELIYDKNRQDIRIGQDISLGFAVPSLDGMIAILEGRGILNRSEIIQPGPNTRFFFIHDPNGVTIQFVEYIQ